MSLQGQGDFVSLYVVIVGRLLGDLWVIQKMS